MTSHEELGAIARRIVLTGLLALLGMAGALLLGGSVLPATASAECLECEGPTTYPLMIQINGIGTVKRGSTTYCQSSTMAGATCEKFLLEGQVVTLTATPGAGMTFQGWEGDCSGTGNCEVAMSAEETVTATFADVTPPAVPTITSPTSGQLLERTSEEPVTVAFDNSGDSSAVSFLCRVDVADSSGASGCSPPSWTTGNLSAGTHTVYVWAKDAFGNISSPASRSFEIVIVPPKGEEPPQEEGGSGSGGTPGTESTGGTLVVDAFPPASIDARAIVKTRLLGKLTVFRKLALKGLPAGAKVAVTCKGKGCPFKRKQIGVRNGVADLTALFANRKLAAGTLIELKVSAPGMTGQAIDVKTRAGKVPKVIKS